ncbi:hypothetical protein [Parasphingopyxis marina]|uniref:Uncharacterized protein n=1 Tax=Parasphingopyxis marina TaxID=2761622 RepID=A0A842I2C7_9SPHN|nr:hypothetical protein [Parasphingopyxis marina]MBC2778420.1 hypothetical protein [Parasphingopyxis marina]
MRERAYTGGLGPLLRALRQRAGAEPVIEDVRTTPWASITFSGARHRIALRLEGASAPDAARAMSEGLDYAEFDLGAYILVDIAVAETRLAGDGVHLVIEALVIEND